MTIDSKLKFNTHISNICSKASKQINVLRRMTNVLDVKSKFAIYRSFIKCHFQYCNLVWHFCGRGNGKKIELIQERAFVFNDTQTEYKKLLQQANALPLSYERQISILVEVFKTINKMNPSFMHDIFKLHECQYELRNKSQMVVPKYNTVIYGYNSLAVHGSLLWNFVSQKVKRKTNVKEFQAALIQSTNSNLCSCFKGKEQSFFSNNFIVLNHIQICFITIYDGCLT